MAIIRDPHFGVGGRGTVALWFTVYLTESSATDLWFNAEQGVKIIADYGVSDVYKLDGKPCWVDTSTRGLVRWIGAFK